MINLRREKYRVFVIIITEQILLNFKSKKERKTIMTNKELIRAFYKEFFNDHIVESADKYVAEGYIQHNPGVQQGRESLKSAFADKFVTEPTFKLDIKMLIEDGDMVAVYLKNVDSDGNTKCRVVDIYRIENGKLAEHWDVLQPVK